MGPMRRCSKTGCQSPALATLTYNYADSQVVIGPLSRRAEPHTYDLCGEHARRTTAPRGWEVLRLASDLREQKPTNDDLLALADAVREAGRPAPAVVTPPADETGRESTRRGHLRVLTTD